MIDDQKRAYLSRAFARMRDEAIHSAQLGRTNALREAAAKGAAQSGRTLLTVRSEYDSAFQTTTEKMVRLVHELSGEVDDSATHEIEQGSTTLRDALSNDLADYFGHVCSWAGRNATEPLGNEFLNNAEKHIVATVDDFRHGILGGVRLARDPLVSVVTSITNSPGAIVQSGVASVQHALSSSEAAQLQRALKAFLESPEVKALPLDEKQSIADVAEVLAGELSGPKPDGSKIARWGKRLVDIAERVGIGVATAALSHLLLGK